MSFAKSRYINLIDVMRHNHCLRFPSDGKRKLHCSNENIVFLHQNIVIIWFASECDEKMADERINAND